VGTVVLGRWASQLLLAERDRLCFGATGGAGCKYTKDQGRHVTSRYATQPQLARDDCLLIHGCERKSRNKMPEERSWCNLPERRNLMTWIYWKTSMEVKRTTIRWPTTA